MASFFDEVMALSPLLFWRCKDLTGNTITDYSGNNFHGDVVSGTVVLGQQSAVETDPEARSVYIPNDFANNICEIVTPPVELLFTGNFTIALFGKHELTSGSQYLFARGGSANSTVDGLHFLTGGSDTRSLRCHFRTDDGLGNFALVDVLSQTNHLIGVDYCFWVTRNGPVVRLHRNDEIVGEITDGDTNPLRVDVSDRLRFGSAGNNLAPAKGWFSELIICDYAWTESQGIGVYESAINAVFLSGVSNVIPTAMLDGSDDPDPITFPFRHNWTNDLIERISFKTSIAQAKTGPEEARKVRPKPRRELEIHQMLRDDRDRNALRSKLWASQHAEWFIPILEDREQIGSQASGTTVFSISTAFKDYQAQRWLHVRELDAFERITKSENLEILSFAASSVTTLTGLSDDYDGNVEACPARRAIVRASSNRGHTDAVEDLVITARLLAEDEPETPNRITAWTPTQTYLGYEVFRDIDWQSNDWSELREYELDRQLEDVDFESGVFGVESDTPGNQESFSHRIWIKGREKNSQFLGWFYDRAGSAKYLWAPSMQKDFTILSTGGFGEFTVQDTVYSDSYTLAEARRDLAFVYNDGSMILRRVTAFSKGSGQETLTLNGSVPTQTSLRSVSLLKFCRLDSDQFEIAKRSDDIWIYAWRFRELLESPS